METRNRAILFQGLVVDIEQMEVRIGRKGGIPTRSSVIPEALRCCLSTKTGRLP